MNPKALPCYNITSVLATVANVLGESMKVPCD